MKKHVIKFKYYNKETFIICTYVNIIHKEFIFVKNENAKFNNDYFYLL